MIEWIAGITGAIGTFLVYAGARSFYKWFPHPLTLPLLIGTIFMVTFLLVTGISYDTYMIGGQWIERLLGPAVVALAYPLYQQRSMLKRYFIPLLSGVTFGTCIGLVTSYSLSVLLGMEKTLIYSLLPNSVTTPVAMEVSETIGGYPAITAIFVMVAGIGGVVAGPYWFRLLGIKDPVSKGIATGTASHAIGTAKALESSEEEGAASSVSMTISAVLVSILVPVAALWFF
ncbi:LrgB family protein [Alteribacillus sp. HJP-4]|uniref:LrgB family protein n=1 Tax=Alteribacillus sp. HJP-4 TaxID=2775394 RepID=UPI0035CD156D